MKSMVKRVGNLKAMEQMDREVLIMKKLNHPHIVKIKEVFETAEKYFLIME
jgi:serine/threonine protein kinase